MSLISRPDTAAAILSLWCKAAFRLNVAFFLAPIRAAVLDATVLAISLYNCFYSNMDDEVNLAV
jgi:hypothetical protein